MPNSLKNHGRHNHGFTLFELLAVMLIMAVLASIAIPSYKRSQIKASETVLAEDLFQIRRALDAYFADRGRYPDNLGQLVEDRYLRDVPKDPLTRSADTWQCVSPLVDANGQLPEGGCFDVKSGSDLVGLNDVPYREW